MNEFNASGKQLKNSCSSLPANRLGAIDKANYPHSSNQASDLVYMQNPQNTIQQIKLSKSQPQYKFNQQQA